MLCVVLVLFGCTNKMTFDYPLLMLSKNEAIRYLCLAANPLEIATGPNFIRLGFSHTALYARPPLHGNVRHLWNEHQLTDAIMLTIYKSTHPISRQFLDLSKFTEGGFVEAVHRFICQPTASNSLMTSHHIVTSHRACQRYNLQGLSH